MPIARSQSISLALHILTIALLLILSSGSFLAPPHPLVARTATPIFLAPLRLPHWTEERGGGSNNSVEPARRGVPPPRSYRTFIPPMVHSDPKLATTPTIDFDVPPIAVASVNIGDPLSNVRNGLYGNKGGGGIGDGPGGRGIGDTPGGRPGLSGRVGGPIEPAEVLYQVDPEFSEDARKARFQGIVVLMIEVGVDGRAHNPKVVQNPGMGLDAKAIEAVEQWRFRPAQRAGQALVSTARVEVHFHLM